MNQPNSGRHAVEQRLRPNHAPSRPAPGGAGRGRAIEAGLLNLVQQRRAYAAIERLIDLLDAIEAHTADLEDCDDEDGDDAEADTADIEDSHDLEDDRCDVEPATGWGSL